MIQCCIGTVTEVTGVRDGVQELKVCLPGGGEALAIHYTDAFRPARSGDRVWLNTTAVNLGLGTGGYHFIIAFAADDAADIGDEADRNQAAAGLAGMADLTGTMRTGQTGQTGQAYQTGRMGQAAQTDQAGHMMKMRYTPLQRAVLAAEEPASPYHALFLEDRRLDGMPVLIGELHSMLPVAAAWLRYRHPGPLKIAYIMTDGGALPLAFSRHAFRLRQGGWIDATITYGHAYGGEIETLNKFTALIAARHIAGADVAIVTMGPGIAGTGTTLGHTGIETGEIANAAARLGGKPVLIPRISFADSRARHSGISHHTLSVLRYVIHAPLEIVLPHALGAPQRQRMLRQLEEVPDLPVRWVRRVTPEEMGNALDRLGMRVATMGREFEQDPAFYLAVGAAAERALELSGLGG